MCWIYKVFWKRAWTDFNQQCHGSFVLKANMTRSQVLKLWESTPDPAKLVAEQYSLGFDNGFLALSWLISNLLGRHRRLYVFVSQGWEETCYSSSRPKTRRTRPFSLPLQSTTMYTRIYHITVHCTVPGKICSFFWLELVQSPCPFIDCLVSHSSVWS